MGPARRLERKGGLSNWDNSKGHRGGGVPLPRHEVDHKEAISHVGILLDSDTRTVGGGSILLCY